MPKSYVTYPSSDGSQSQYTIPFDYLAREHVKATVDGVETPFSFISTNVIQFTTNRSGLVKIYRQTPPGELLNIDFNGSVLVDGNMDVSHTQTLFINEEAQDRTNTLSHDANFKSTNDTSSKRSVKIEAPTEGTEAANTVTTAGGINADTLDGYHASDFLINGVASTYNISVYTDWPGLALNKPTDGTNAQLLGFTNGAYRWAVILGDATAEAGGNTGSDFNVSRFNDSGAWIDAPLVINRSTGKSTFANEVQANGPLIANGGFKYMRSISLPDNTDLNTVVEAGVYDVYSPANAPFTGNLWYINVDRYSGNSSYVRQTITLLNTNNVAAIWMRVRLNGFWQSWQPVGGQVTPGHFGANGSSTPGAATDSSVAIQRMLESGLPWLIDQYYVVNTAVVVTAAPSQVGINGEGYGTRSGIVLNSGGRIELKGMNQENPIGWQADQFNLNNITFFVNNNDNNTPLTLSAENGDIGSHSPGINLSNINIVPTSNINGSSDACLKLENIRQGVLSNVSVAGKYGAYQGAGIVHSCGENSAPVEIVSYGCRAAHLATGFLLNASTGSGQNDDSQGHHWDKCTALAVNRGWHLQGGPQGFGEWSNLTGCHAYFRELGFFSENYGNLRIRDGYFLAHGGLFPEAQGIATTGSSIEPMTIVEGNRIRLDGSTSPIRRALNLSASMSGRVAGNRSTHTSTLNIIPATYTYTDNT